MFAFDLKWNDSFLLLMLIGNKVNGVLLKILKNKNYMRKCSVSNYKLFGY